MFVVPDMRNQGAQTLAPDSHIAVASNHVGSMVETSNILVITESCHSSSEKITRGERSALQKKDF